MADTVIIGTRGSELAMWQANWVKAKIEATHPDLSVALEIVKTKGDKILDVPLAKVGGKGLFVKEIEDALQNGRIDLAVHSMKDMPAEIPEDLCIGAVPERGNPADVLISKTGAPFAKLRQDARIGTSSLRRGAQLSLARKDIRITALRGNLGTRLNKLKTEDLDAIVLAAAGVLRLGLAHRISEFLDTDLMLPAVGQGALCIEIRKGDQRIGPLMEGLDHAATRQVVMGERAFLNRLGGGCQVPIAGHGRILADGTFSLTGLVAAVDGTAVFKASLAGPVKTAETIGVQLAEQLAERGAETIIEQLKEDAEKS